MPDPQKKIEALIASLEELRLHVGKKDLSVGSRNINSQLFFSLANACLRNRAVLLYGGMGANKTTLINLLGTSFLSLGLGDVENLMVTGHPEQTEEKMVGFLDPRQWTRPGSTAVEVLWTLWARSRWKLINEINRFPSGKQNLFLEILQKRKISYAGQVLEPGDTCYFATMNPEFSATYPLDEGLSDRVRQDLRDFCRAMAFLLHQDGNLEVLKAVAPYVIWHRVTPIRSALDSPPYYGARKLAFVSGLVERSINRTLNERAEMNLVFSRAVDGEMALDLALRELSAYDDPIARLDFIPSLEQMLCR